MVQVPALSDRKVAVLESIQLPVLKVDFHLGDPDTVYPVHESMWPCYPSGLG